jgi:putative methanogenesis marker protein 1
VAFSEGDALVKVDGLQRTVPAEETLRQAEQPARALGVTRLADITGLDRVGIPTYCAIVPRSEDGISVYTGKGIRPVDAKVGALMEAIERQTALHARPATLQGSYDCLRNEYQVLDPVTLAEPVSHEYSEHSEYSWVWGRDLVSNEPVLVPASFAMYTWAVDPCRPCFELSTSSGLASGNCREEAICHALCELIERDAWTLAELGAHYLPGARHKLLGNEASVSTQDDFEFLTSLDAVGEPGVELFREAGMFPLFHEITSDLGIPTIFAAVADETISGFPMVHCGVGTHPNAHVALTRSLTEMAQSRCVDIQGVREDLLPPGSPESKFALHTRRVSAVNRNMWCLRESAVSKSIHELPSFQSTDLRSDLEHIVARLAACGLRQVIVVDFRSEHSHFAVVRVIVPGLESWVTDRGRVGSRALSFWKRNV